MWHEVAHVLWFHPLAFLLVILAHVSPIQYPLCVLASLSRLRRLFLILLQLEQMTVLVSFPWPHPTQRLRDLRNW